MVLLLIEAGADYTCRDGDGRIPLHWAAHNPRIGCLSALLKKVKPSEWVVQGCCLIRRLFERRRFAVITASTRLMPLA